MLYNEPGSARRSGGNIVTLEVTVPGWVALLLLAAIVAVLALARRGGA
ncbi:MAG: hypothetical protein QME94_19795 [Anaerolineae bacterium]|nr:hypothetical protein [Anaerolineae bacterium]